MSKIYITFFTMVFLFLFLLVSRANGANCLGDGVTVSGSFSNEAGNCFGVQTVVEKSGLTTGAPNLASKWPIQIASKALGIALSFLGVIFFLLMLYAGVTWMMAMGADEKVQKAKDTLEAAIIGLVIVIGAYALSAFVFKNILGVTVGNSASSTDSSTTTEIDCTKQENNTQPCGGRNSNSHCDYKYKKCVSFCENTYKHLNGTCKSACVAPEEKVDVTDICPSEQVCCVKK